MGYWPLTKRLLKLEEDLATLGVRPSARNRGPLYFDIHREYSTVRFVYHGDRTKWFHIYIPCVIKMSKAELGHMLREFLVMGTVPKCYRAGLINIFNKADHHGL